MSASEAGGSPPTQPAFSGPPPRPPKITARGIENQPDEPNRRIYLSNWVMVQDLAELLSVKPFKIVARLLEMRQFKHANDAIDFENASIIAREHGYQTERLLPDSF